jgi:hypothetical protein
VQKKSRKKKRKTVLQTLTARNKKNREKLRIRKLQGLKTVYGPLHFTSDFMSVSFVRVHCARIPHQE